MYRKMSRAKLSPVEIEPAGAEVSGNEPVIAAWQ
jgi:hypothetical protein